MIKHMAANSLEGENYLCNPVPFPNPKKLVYDWTFVTCKKCLKQGGYNGR